MLTIYLVKMDSGFTINPLLEKGRDANFISLKLQLNAVLNVYNNILHYQIKIWSLRTWPKNL